MRRLFNMLVNNVREHFMIYLALWLRDVLPGID